MDMTVSWPDSKFWCRIEAVGGPIDVVATDGPIAFDDEEYDGYWVSSSRTIVVNVGNGASAARRTLLHELLHMAFDEPSKDVLRILRNDDREETLVRFLEPVLYDVLTRNGWLSLPEPPK